MDNLLHWLWLQCCLGVDNRRIHSILEMYDHDASQIYSSSEYELRLTHLFTEKELQKLRNKDLSTAEKIARNCETFGQQMIPLTDRDYPPMLKAIQSPPVVLYSQGIVPDWNRLYVGIVGTRNATQTGRQSAYRFALQLAEQGAVIVSGGALGIDMQAHIGALNAGGTTISVLGCGLNYNYLSDSQDLRKSIVKNGLLLSEYPPNYPPTKYTFPKRNRIISGMSHCTLVVEAGRRSGALITAKYAVEQHKTVFAIPGSVTSESNQGSNRLIQEGAKTALSGEDILNWYREKHPTVKLPKSQPTKLKYSYDSIIGNILQKDEGENFIPPLKQVKKSPQTKDLSAVARTKKPQKKQTEKKKFKKISSELLTENAVAVYHTISDVPIYVDDIKIKTNLSVHQILIALTELELNGMIAAVSGKRYIRTDGT